MTEQEFIFAAREMGVTDEGIESAIGSYKTIKEKFPDAALSDFLGIAKETQEKLKGSDDGSLTACGGWY